MSHQWGLRCLFLLTGAALGWIGGKAYLEFGHVLAGDPGSAVEWGASARAVISAASDADAWLKGAPDYYEGVHPMEVAQGMRPWAIAVAGIGLAIAAGRGWLLRAGVSPKAHLRARRKPRAPE